MRGNSFLLENFREFYSLLRRQYIRIFVEASVPFSSEENAHHLHQLVEDIVEKLKGCLENQRLNVMHQGGEYALAQYHDLQYLMVALVDEFFLSEMWSGQTVWEQSIFEERLFGSHIAGEEIFRRIETLLSDRNAEQREMAICYLQALGLGFFGQYREQADKLVSLKRRLFTFVHGYAPEIGNENYTISIEGYQNLMEDSIVQVLPNARGWHTILYCTVIGYLLMSFILWQGATKELADVANSIVSTEGKGLGG